MKSSRNQMGCLVSLTDGGHQNHFCQFATSEQESLHSAV